MKEVSAKVQKLFLKHDLTIEESLLILVGLKGSVESAMMDLLAKQRQKSSTVDKKAVTQQT